MTDHRCRRADRCLRWEFDPDTGRRLGGTINAEHGLCELCASLVVRALAEIPRNYAELELVLAKVTQRGNEPVSGTREPPMPIRGDVEALQAELVHETLCWAESTSEVLQITLDTQRSQRTRPGPLVQRSCALLSRSFPVFLALRDVVHSGWLFGDSTELIRDGLDGALVLLDLHHRSRAVTGQNRLINRLSAPCPRCERMSLEREDGSETIGCASCGKFFTWSEYEALCTILTGSPGLAA